MEEIDLSQFIDELRRELGEAIAKGANAELHFQPKDIEVELQFAAESKRDGSGKLSFKVFGIGAEGGGGLARTTSATHRLKLSLALVDSEGNTPLISARSRDSDPA